MLGWKLNENAVSCFSLTNPLKGTTYFDTKIYTNKFGFRDVGIDSEVPKNSIVALGDSWTFGYGVDFDESYPFILSKILNIPVVNMGIPAYGSAATILLFERYVEKLMPSKVVLFTHGMFTRSRCFSNEEADTTLMPCFWWNKSTQAIEIRTPKPGHVFRQANKHIYPGGALTAGYDTFEYFHTPESLIIVFPQNPEWLPVVSDGLYSLSKDEEK